MRLVFLNHNPAWAGTFFRAYHLGRALRARGHEVLVVTTHATGRWRGGVERHGGVVVAHMPDLLSGRGRTGWDLWNLFHRLRLVQGRRCDLVHAFDSRPAVIYPALRLRDGGARLVLDWADWWGRGGTTRERSGPLLGALIEPVEQWFEEAYRREAHGTTVISRALGERAAGLGVPAGRIHRFPHGCSRERVAPMERAVARRALGVDATAPLVLHLGALVPGDARLLSDAVTTARRRHPRLRLVLVGSVRTRLTLPPDALLRTGRVDDAELSLWLGAADVCVVPLRDTVANRGRWPSKVNDYLAAGRATLLPAVGDAADAISAAGAGWSTPPEADALGQRMAEVLDDPGALAVAGRAARELAEGPLAWTHIAGGVEAFYRRVLEDA
ncbi:MAG: glycosyltransferase [Gemmatimonadota bacterium]